MGYTKSQIEKLKKDKELSDKMWANPELFYKVQNSFEYDDVVKVNLRSQRADGQFPYTFIVLGKVGTRAVVTHKH